MCHGSNNCYIRALDISAKAAKLLEDTSLASALASKRRSTSSKPDADDSEFLLLNEQAQAEGNAPHQQIQPNNDIDCIDSAIPTDDRGPEQSNGNDDAIEQQQQQCNADTSPDDNSIGDVSNSTVDQ